MWTWEMVLVGRERQSFPRMLPSLSCSILIQLTFSPKKLLPFPLHGIDAVQIDLSDGIALTFFRKGKQHDEFFSLEFSVLSCQIWKAGQAVSQ